MKLAEALALRSDAMKRSDHLRTRAPANARYQEGENPAEESDKAPVANASVIIGNSRSARATRTCSRAVFSPIPHCQDSQCAVDFIPHDRQPSAASNSPINTDSRHVATAS